MGRYEQEADAMYIERSIDTALAQWQAASDRKPLLLRGARQTGKTTAIRQLGKRFKYFVEVNLEANRQAHACFGERLEMAEVVHNLEIHLNCRIVPGETLLFLDEIQACPRAISALRFFYEQLPGLHVAAAGSLLEFALGELSDFGVGRIRNLFVYPFSFREFLKALNEEVLLSVLDEASFTRPPAEVAHRRLLEALRNYFIVGGMPAAVLKYAQTGSYYEAQREQDDILVSLKADFGKYRRRVAPEVVRRTLASVSEQMGGKFVYSNASQDLSYQQGRLCTDLLEQARLIHRVVCSHANGLPLGGDINLKSQKFLLLDTGLYLRECGLDLREWITLPPDEFVNRGALAELFAGLELMKALSPFQESALYYWHREGRNANAEVDYLLQVNNAILPVEVKSGSRGSMKSLRLFMEEKRVPLAIRTSSEPLSQLDTIKIIPLYLLSDYERLLAP